MAGQLFSVTESHVLRLEPAVRPETLDCRQQLAETAGSARGRGAVPLPSPGAPDGLRCRRNPPTHPRFHCCLASAVLEEQNEEGQNEEWDGAAALSVRGEVQDPEEGRLLGPHGHGAANQSYRSKEQEMRFERRTGSRFPQAPNTRTDSKEG